MFAPAPNAGGIDDRCCNARHDRNRPRAAAKTSRSLMRREHLPLPDGLVAAARERRLAWHALQSPGSTRPDHNDATVEISIADASTGGARRQAHRRANLRDDVARAMPKPTRPA
jgi:hypothetical protein